MTDTSGPAIAKPITVLFFGASGVGKGTQVNLLIEYLQKNSPQKAVHIDMGKLLREQVATGSYSGQLTNEIISVGNRMPDFMPIYLQTRMLVENLTGDEHIVADGLARGADQTRGFDDAMKFYGRDNFQIVYIELSEESIMKRLLARGRNDDTEASIRNRLGWYKTEVEPQIAIFKERGRTIHRIDGEPDVDTIHKDILEKLGLV